MAEPVSTQGKVKLDLIDLAKFYGNKRAVECARLPIEKGEFLTLLGPSGSGKTTLLTLIAGFAEPDRGKILVDGRDITNIPPERRNFGMMFQGYALFPHMTVAENVAFPLVVRKTPKAEVQQRVEKALAQVRLETYGERLPKQLSGGQQQRVALARASVFEPELLLLDEPLSALDRKLRGEMQAEIKHAHAILGKTFIYVTHDQDEALSLSDRIVILRDGEIVQIGSPTELYQRPKSRFVASFLGESNFVTGRVVSRNADSIDYAVKDAVFTYRGPVETVADTALLSLRPEKICVQAEEPEQVSGGKVQGTIASRSYFGSTVVYRVETEHLGPLMISRPAWGKQFDDAIGKQIWLSWDGDAAIAVQDDE
jgi:putative spermidine/putrescine transport system ATP-binding protein